MVIARAGTPDCDHNRGVDGHQSPQRQHPAAGRSVTSQRPPAQTQPIRLDWPLISVSSGRQMYRHR